MGGRWYLELSATAFGIKESGAKCFWLKLAAAAVDAISRERRCWIPNANWNTDKNSFCQLMPLGL